MSHTIPNEQAPRKIVSVRPEDSVAIAAARMLSENVGCVLVTDAMARLVGILTERDLLPLLRDSARRAGEVPVAAVMTEQIVSCPPGTSVGGAQELMTRYRIRHLPVVEGGCPVAVVSARDVMKQQRQMELEMRRAAEEATRTFTFLRRIDFQEVVELVTHDAARLLGATRSVFRCSEEADTSTYRNGCVCPEDRLPCRLDSEAVVTDRPPPCCKDLGAGCGSRLIPLRAPRRDEITGETVTDYSAYLCICGLDAVSQKSPELVDYKISLIREGLSAKLVNAKLFQEYRAAREIAQTDPLTGVGSRAMFQDRLEEACQRASRYGRPFCLAILDIDHFKSLNDTFGHIAGDTALVEISGCMKQDLRRADILARYGGDEFVLLMPELSLSQGRTCMERLVRGIRTLAIPDLPPLTVSVGLVHQDGPESISPVALSGDWSLSLPPDEVIRRADVALYQAKRAGRNRIECWDGAASAPGELEVTQKTGEETLCP